MVRRLRHRFLKGKRQEYPMNNDELKGKVEKVKGQAKQAWGEAANDPDTYDEGVADETAGSVQEGFGRARRKVGEVLHEVAHKIKD
jgi:uncharacterized protein YjbJ (UPF0337 family)